MQSPQQHLTPIQQLLQACEVKNWKQATRIMSLHPRVDPGMITEAQRRSIDSSLRRWKGEPINKESITDRLMGHYEYCARCFEFTKRYKEVVPDKFWPNETGTHICRECDEFLINQKVG